MAQFAADTFTGTGSTTLSTYNAAWTKHTSYTPTMRLNAGGTVCVNTAATDTVSCYYHSGSPASADYSVSADVVFIGTVGTQLGSVVGRVDTAANTFYTARALGGTGYQIFKFVAGSATQLGSSSSRTFSADTVYPIKLEMVGGAIKLYKDNEGTATITPGADTDITAAGKSGLRLLPSSAAYYVSADNFSADDIGATVPTLSALSAINITATSAQPQITYTF